MPNNESVLLVSTILATICFVMPVFFGASGRVNRVLMVIACYVIAFEYLLSLYNARAATTVIILALVFAALWKILGLAKQMVRDTNYPSRRRCY